MRVILCLLFFTSCGALTPINQVIHNNTLIEKSALKHVIEFENQCDKRVEIEITFAKIPGNYVGMCVWFLGPKYLRYITLDIEAWNRYDYYQREALLFHELGHCVLNRNHNDKIINYTPESIMLSKMFSKWDYYANREGYINELCVDKKQSREFKYNKLPDNYYYDYPIIIFPFDYDTGSTAPLPFRGEYN